MALLVLALHIPPSQLATLGLLAGLAAAFCWALATFLYRRSANILGPLGANALKGLVASALFAGLLLLTADRSLDLRQENLVWLILSGVIGIGVGDTAFFAALTRLGARRLLLLELAAPPFTAMLASLFLDETLVGRDWLGIAGTLAGIAIVVSQPPSDGDGHRFSALGVAYGAIAALSQATGAVLTRQVFETEAISPAASGLVRLLSGLAFVALAGALWRLRSRGQRAQGIREAGSVSSNWRLLKTPRALLSLAAAIVLGTFISIWLQQASFKWSSSVSVPQTLLATSPLFALPLAHFSGDRVSLRALTGAGVAFCGVVLLVLK